MRSNGVCASRASLSPKTHTEQTSRSNRSNGSFGSFGPTSKLYVFELACDSHDKWHLNVFLFVLGFGIGCAMAPSSSDAFDPTTRTESLAYDFDVRLFAHEFVYYYHHHPSPILTPSSSSTSAVRASDGASDTRAKAISPALLSILARSLFEDRK